MNRNLLSTGNVARSTEATARDSGLTAAQLSDLRPYIIDLNQGRFSEDGEVKSTRADVEAIFEEHLPQALQKAGGKLNVVFYAHGGLVSESNGLKIAHKHIQWWVANGVYPIYFIWETGFLETIRSLITQSGSRVLPRSMGARDIFDFTTDPILEVAARALGGPRIWGGMKHSAERFVDTNGGAARIVAELLQKFCAANPGALDLHAVGHSAGSIFHAYFLPIALEATAGQSALPDFKTLHFLAPAIRVDTFKQRLLPLIGSRVDKLNLYTMKRQRELADNCAEVYRKSLLYLIYFALEPEKRAPILGLESCLREDATLKALFGLGGNTAPNAEVIFSDTATATGLRASRSLSHGGFDDDASTLNSVLRWVLGKNNTDVLAQEFPQSRDLEGLYGWDNQADLPPELNFAVRDTTPPASGSNAASATPSSPSPLTPDIRPAGSRKRAVCVGINAYPRSPLSGCVNDAMLWQRTLGEIGFTTTLLTDKQATRQSILDHLIALVRESVAGDVLVFQYSGHGTTVPDQSGDEGDGNDEAFCPVDVFDGALLLDDDIGREVFDLVPENVNMTIFADCCHSGSISRLAQLQFDQSQANQQLNARFLPMTQELLDAFKQFRKDEGLIGSRALTAPRALTQQREILFAACDPRELAWESNGQGDFTRIAMNFLRTSASNTSSDSNNDFMVKVRQEVSKLRRQKPELDGATTLMTRRFLTPLITTVDSNPTISVDVVSEKTTALDKDVRAALVSVADNLDAATKTLRQLV